MSIQTKNRILPFESAILEKIAQILGDTSDGLTGSEMGHKLLQCKIPDTDSAFIKWKRLYNAFANFQNQHKSGNHVIIFINEVMNPALYTESPEKFHARQERLNTVLVLCGFRVDNDGKVHTTARAKNLDEALERANRMKEQLRKRNVHSTIIEFCDTEIIAQNNFHAVLEAMKSITSRIRSISGLTSDGEELVRNSFCLGKSKSPLLAINALDTETLQGEQRGFLNLLIGLYGMIRNPTAHEPKIEWQMDENDALDILTTISFVHRKLDKAYKFNK